MTTVLADTWQKVPPFGIMLQLDGKIPADCNIVILCRNNGYGLQPCGLFMPHQIYTSTLETIRAQFPDTKTFTVIPAKSADYVEVGEI